MRHFKLQDTEIPLTISATGDLEIGKPFTIDDTIYVPIAHCDSMPDCTKCAFNLHSRYCRSISCASDERYDNEYVYFKEVK